MRLINTKTLDLEEFDDIRVPEYAILSHTWNDGEVSFPEWADRKNRRYKPGFQKILWACTHALDKDGISYLWADTNCIDKSSSAELSEAINSMFKWYRRSRICYAYLEDVDYATVEVCKEPQSQFRASRWFTRGWTLQELIAPAEVKFFSHDWREIGSKTDLALCISETTGIAWTCLVKRHLSRSHPVKGYSVAQRLSWASRRSTTRLEDQAYSLLGLFDITMPLVYGEGYEAFSRFLGEIIRKYADHSFFASQLRYVDFLPRSPMEFCDSQDIVTGNSPQLQTHYTPVSHAHPFQLTNTGLQITLPIVPTLVPHFSFGVLDCWEFDSYSTQATRSISRIWIPLLQKGHPELHHYTRLIWPQIFFPVKLVRKHSILRLGDSGNSTTDDSTSTPPASDPASIVNVLEHIDLVSMYVHESILIKKPYATALSVPMWQPRDAASPFLLCFPRGTKDYRLFGIFPSDANTDAELSAGKPPQLPLVAARQMESLLGQVSTQEAKPESLYGTLVVFKKRHSRPPIYIAICLINLPSHKNGGLVYEAVCKILRDWRPQKLKDILPLNVHDFEELDADGNALVTIQKVSCNIRATAKGMEPRFIGLTQVVFDRLQVMEELHLSPNVDANASEGMLQHFGVENSDEEIGNLI